MRFALSRAVARCQARRLRGAVANAPLPTILVLCAVAIAPFLLARVGRALGEELAASITSPEVARALVLGPCLAGAATGALIAVSVPIGSGLGQQLWAGPVDPRVALLSSLMLPTAFAALIVLPSLASFSVGAAAAFPGGWLSGVALVTATLCAVPGGAVVAEGVQRAIRGPLLRRVAVGLGLATWLLIGRVTGAGVLGPLAPTAGALRGTGSVWAALAASGITTIVLAGAWIQLAGERREPRPRSARVRHAELLWRMPVSAGATALVWRRVDVRRSAGAAACLGMTAVVAAVAADSPAPGPFLLATTTTLLGSLVAALVGWGGLAPGLWLWRSAARGRRAIAATTWFAGLAGVATPVALVAALAAVSSGFDVRSAGVVAVLVAIGAGAATIAGSLVPWKGESLGDQIGALSAFAVVAVGTSLAVGVVAPRLAARGTPDALIAVMLCGIASGLAVAFLAYRVERVVR